MNTKTNTLSISTMLSAAICLTPSVSQAVETMQAPDGVTKTRIKVNGKFSDTFLFDPDTNTNGFLNASRDQIANTSALDFSYATPHATDPDLFILVLGAGEIPNSAFTRSSTSAHLLVTTPPEFEINRCVVNVVTAEFTCDLAPPITFDLTWTKTSFGFVFQKVTRDETFGPFTTKFKGDFLIVTATASGSWDGHTGADMLGNLVDTQNTTILREITMAASP